MKIDLMQDIVFPTISIRELAPGENKPKTHNWVNINGKIFIFEFDGGQKLLDEKIEKILDPLKSIVEYQVYNRQVGHTTTMLNGVVNNPNALVLVGNSHQVQWMIRELTQRGWTMEQAKKSVLSIHHLQNGLFGLRDRPLILDNVVLFELFSMMGGKTSGFNERKGEILDAK